jgi:gas vesicle protein
MANQGFLSGLFFGGLVGATLGLLMAPHSGDHTRALLRERTDELKGQVRQTAGETRQRAEAMQARGRELLAENAERITRTAEAVKRTAQESWTEGEAGPATPGGAAAGGSYPGGTA